MEQEKVKKLYPLKFTPSVEEMPWGKQTWNVADLGFENSEICNGWLEGNTIEDLMETYIDRAVGEAAYQYYGRQFPISVKTLDVEGEIPLQVHPDDEEAMHRYDALGKAELLYVAEASEDARIYLGFNRDMTSREFYEKCLDGTVMETLNEVKPSKGEYFIIKPGLVHAVKGHVRLLAVQESSDVNLVLYDRNTPAEEEETRLMHLAEAIDLIDYTRYIPHQEEECGGHGHDGHECGCHDHEEGHSCHCHEEKITDKLVARPEFTVTKVNLTDPLHIYLEQLGCFLVYTCAEGAASVQVPSFNDKGEKCMDNYEIQAGESIVVPAEIPDFFLVPRDRDTVLLETMVESHDEPDEYIDPNTEPFLEGEDYEGLDEEDEDGCSEDGCHDEGCGCHDEGCSCHRHE